MSDLTYQTTGEKVKALLLSFPGKVFMGSLVLLLLAALVIDFKQEPANGVNLPDSQNGARGKKAEISAEDANSLEKSWRASLESRVETQQKTIEKLNKRILEQKQETMQGIKGLSQALKNETGKLATSINGIAKMKRQAPSPAPSPKKEPKTQAHGQESKSASSGTSKVKDPFADIAPGFDETPSPESASASVQGGGGGGGLTSTDKPSNIGALGAPREWETVSIGGKEEDVRPTPVVQDAKKPSMTTLPLGSFSNVTTLTGVMAPTEGSGWPVIMRVNKIMTGPNGASYPVDGCFVLGYAKSDMGTVKPAQLPDGTKADVARVRIELSAMSCDWGSIAFDKNVKGYVQDKDGNAGIEGVVHNRFPKELMMAIGAGALSGAGKGLSKLNNITTSTVNQNGQPVSITQEASQTVKSAMFGMVGSSFKAAGEDVQKYLMKKASEMVSTVEIPSGVACDVVLTRSIDIPDPLESQITGQKRSLYGKNGLL